METAETINRSMNSPEIKRVRGENEEWMVRRKYLSHAKPSGLEVVSRENSERNEVSQRPPVEDPNKGVFNVEAY